MIKALNFLKFSYMYIWMILGVYILGNSILSSNNSNKNIKGKLLACLLSFIGCILMNLKNILKKGMNKLGLWVRVPVILK